MHKIVTERLQEDAEKEQGDPSVRGRVQPEKDWMVRKMDNMKAIEHRRCPTSVL